MGEKSDKEIIKYFLEVFFMNSASISLLLAMISLLSFTPRFFQYSITLLSAITTETKMLPIQRPLVASSIPA
jgi:hypothetical protein